MPPIILPQAFLHYPNTFKPVSHTGVMKNTSSTVLNFTNVVYSMQATARLLRSLWKSVELVFQLSFGPCSKDLYQWFPLWENWTWVWSSPGICSWPVPLHNVHGSTGWCDSGSWRRPPYICRWHTTLLPNVFEWLWIYQIQIVSLNAEN